MKGERDPATTAEEEGNLVSGYQHGYEGNEKTSVKSAREQLEKPEGKEIRDGVEGRREEKTVEEEEKDNGDESGEGLISSSAARRNRYSAYVPGKVACRL